MKSFFSNDANFKPRNKIFDTIESSIVPQITAKSNLTDSTEMPNRYRSFTNTAARQTENNSSVIGVAKRLFQDADKSYSSSFLAKTSYTETTFNSVEEQQNNSSKKLIVKTSSSSNSSYSVKTDSSRKGKDSSNFEAAEYKENVSFKSSSSASKQSDEYIDEEPEVIDLSTISDQVEEEQVQSEGVPETKDVDNMKQIIQSLKEENEYLVGQNKSCVDAYNKVYGHYTEIFDNFTSFRALFVESSNKNREMANQINNYKIIIQNLKQEVESNVSGVTAAKQQLIDQQNLIAMKDDTIKNLNNIITTLNYQNNRVFTTRTNNIKDNIENLTDTMNNLKIDIIAQIPESVKQVTTRKLAIQNKEVIKSFESIQIKSNETMKQSFEMILAKSKVSSFEEFNKVILDAMQTQKHAYSKEIGDSITSLHNDFINNLSTIINSQNFTGLKDDIFNEIRHSTSSLFEKMDIIKEEVGYRHAVSKREDHQNDLIKALNFKANTLKNELMHSNAQGFIDLTNQFKNLVSLLTEIKERIFQTSQTSISLSDRLNDIKMGQINSDILVKDKFAVNETELIQFKELLMKLSELMMKSVKMDSSSTNVTISRRNSTESYSTPQSDNNHTRELTETNEFDELVSSEDEDSFRLRSEQRNIINSTFKTLNSNENVSMLNSDTSEQKVKKKVLFNESVTILNNGSTVKLEDQTKNSYDDHLIFKQIDSLPEGTSNYMHLSGLNSFFMNTNSAQERFTNKTKQAKAQLLHKMSSEDNKFNAFEELNTSNDSFDIDNIFKTHFKGSVGRGGYKRRNLRNSVKTGQVSKTIKGKPKE